MTTGRVAVALDDAAEYFGDELNDATKKVMRMVAR